MYIHIKYLRIIFRVTRVFRITFQCGSSEEDKLLRQKDFLSTSSLIKCMVFNWYLYHIFIDYLQRNSCFLNYVTMWQQWRGQTMAQAALFNVYNELASPIVYYNTSPVFPYSPKYHFLQLCNLRYKIMKNLAQNRCVLTLLWFPEANFILLDIINDVI